MHRIRAAGVGTEDLVKQVDAADSGPLVDSPRQRQMTGVGDAPRARTVAMSGRRYETILPTWGGNAGDTTPWFTGGLG